MGNKPFMRPVFLRLNNGQTGSYQASNASEAIEYLKRFWPASRGGEYRRAKAICRSAVDNLVSAESARNYLIAAAERAGILDRSRKIGLANADRSRGPGNQAKLPPILAAA